MMKKKNIGIITGILVLVLFMTTLSIAAAPDIGGRCVAPGSLITHHPAPIMRVTTAIQGTSGQDDDFVLDFEVDRDSPYFRNELSIEQRKDYVAEHHLDSLEEAPNHENISCSELI